MTDQEICEAYGIDQFKLAAIRGKVKKMMQSKGWVGNEDAHLQDALDDHHQQNSHRPTDDLGSSIFEMMAGLNDVYAANLKVRA